MLLAAWMDAGSSQHAALRTNSGGKKRSFAASRATARAVGDSRFFKDGKMVPKLAEPVRGCAHILNYLNEFVHMEYRSVKSENDKNYFVIGPN